MRLLTVKNVPGRWERIPPPSLGRGIQHNIAQTPQKILPDLRLTPLLRPAKAGFGGQSLPFTTHAPPSFGFIDSSKLFEWQTTPNSAPAKTYSFCPLLLTPYDSRLTTYYLSPSFALPNRATAGQAYDLPPIYSSSPKTPRCSWSNAFASG